MTATAADRARERAARIAARSANRGLPPPLDLSDGMRQILAEPHVTDDLRQRVLTAAQEVADLLDANRGTGDAYVRWRRLLLRAATPPGVRIDRLVIAERDGWRCAFCGDPVLRVVIPPGGWAHPLAASLDHVKPLASGGLNTPENVRLAHYACNAASSALPRSVRERRSRDWESLMSAPRRSRHRGRGRSTRAIRK